MLASPPRRGVAADEVAGFCLGQRQAWASAVGLQQPTLATAGQRGELGPEGLAGQHPTESAALFFHLSPEVGDWTC